MALALAARLLVLDPTDPRPYLIQTEGFRQLRRLPEAATAAKAAVTHAPQSATAFAAFAQIKGEQSQLLEAESLIRESLRLDPKQARYYGFLAQLQYLQQQPDEALTTATTGLRIDAHHTDCLMWRAMAHEALEKPTAADADFKLVMRNVPASPLAHEWYGRLLLQRYEPFLAAPHLAEALRLAPGNLAVLLLLRNAHWRQQWPRWLLLQHRKLRQDWNAGRPFSWRILPVGLGTPIYAGRSWWRTRQHPIFQDKIPGLHQNLLRKWLAIVGLIAAPMAILYAIVIFELPPYTLIILLTAMIRAFMTKDKNS